MTSGEAATPLSTRASQYALYKIMHMAVKLQPLVGRSLVAGSIALVDIQQNGASAAPDTLDTIKARRHIEVPLGTARIWKVPQKDLQGPRDGWWYVDTNDDPTQSLGPALNSWFYGQTYNLMNTTTTEVKQYSGACFLLELTVKYAFSNYTPKPALATLSKEVRTPASEATFGNDLDGALVIRMPASFSEAMARDTEKAGALGSTFWAVSSTVVQTLADSFPPWGWVFKAGWFVVRKVFGQATRDGSFYVKVYASAEDAVKDSPLFVNGQGKRLPAGSYRVEQLNSANLQKNTQPSPQSRFNPTGGDYLPLSMAGAPAEELPPLYNIVEGQVTKYDPPWGGLSPGERSDLNGAGILMARPIIHYVGSTDSVKAIKMKYIAYHSGEGWKEQELRGKYVCLMEFQENSFLLGGYQLRELGVLHGYHSLTASFDSTWNHLDQEKLSHLNDPGGQSGAFECPSDERLFGASWLRLPVRWEGTAADLVHNHGIWGHLEHTHGDRPRTLAIEACYLGGINPWESEGSITPAGNAIILWAAGKIWALTTTQKDPTLWTYKGPQFFATFYDDKKWSNINPWYTLDHQETQAQEEKEDDEIELEFLPPPPNAMDALADAVARSNLTDVLSAIRLSTVPK